MFETRTQITNAATGALVQDLGTTLPRRPTFSPDGRWLSAGDRLVNLQTGVTVSLGVPATISHFLTDGRIFAADVTGTRVLCPY
ncbi:MAG TPA: hypothetical protein VJN18_02005 [Polyangiaceae bacterium]|nr:hypothetical protein [Polyangiaceae bacterium]